MEWETILWKAVKPSEVDNIVVGRYYYANYSMHYGAVVSEGYSTPEEVVDDLFTRAQEIGEIKGESLEVTVPTDEDVEDFEDFEHDAEEVIASITGHLPSEEEK